MANLARPHRLPLASVLLLLIACSPRSGGEVAPTTDPDIRGTVTKVNVTVEPRTVLVEEKPEESSGSAKASVTLTDETRLLRRTADGAQRSELQDLNVGQTVSVWFTGPIMESFPVQATAGTVVIESP